MKSLRALEPGSQKARRRSGLPVPEELPSALARPVGAAEMSYCQGTSVAYSLILCRLIYYAILKKQLYKQRLCHSCNYSILLIYDPLPDQKSIFVYMRTYGYGIVYLLIAAI